MNLKLKLVGLRREWTPLSADLQLISKAAPCRAARSNSVFLACFSSLACFFLLFTCFSRVSCCWQRRDGQFSHCLELPTACAGAVIDTLLDTPLGSDWLFDPVVVDSCKWP